MDEALTLALALGVALGVAFDLGSFFTAAALANFPMAGLPIASKQDFKKEAETGVALITV